MNPNSSFQSAKIYAFPAGGRFALRVQGDEAAAANVQLPYGVKLVSGSGWYRRRSDPKREQ